MNQLIRDGSLPGWRYFDSPRRFLGTDYGTQKGWERIKEDTPSAVNEDASTEIEFRQLELDEVTPFDEKLSP